MPLKRLIADKGYDSQVLVDYLQNRGIEAMIPSRSNALNPRACDKWLTRNGILLSATLAK